MQFQVLRVLVLFAANFADDFPIFLYMFEIFGLVV